MAEDKRQNPFKYPTAEDVAAAPGDRNWKAARNIAVRSFGGIPLKAILLGDADHAPMVKGIHDLTTLCYQIVDEINRYDEADPITGDRASTLDPDGFGSIAVLKDVLVTMLTHHGCPPAEESE